MKPIFALIALASLAFQAGRAMPVAADSEHYEFCCQSLTFSD